VYDGLEAINERISDSGSLSFLKKTASVSIAQVTIIPTDATYSFTSTCPDNFPITLYRIVVNNQSDQDKTIHNYFNWSEGSFTSATITDNIVLEGDGVSLFTSIYGMSSEGILPAEGAQINMLSKKLSGDTYDFQNNSFRYLVSSTQYTEDDINDILNSSTNLVPIVNPSDGVYSVNFTYTNTSEFPYIYLIWDYRNAANALDLCYSDVSALDVCCDCETAPIVCKQLVSFDIATDGERTLYYTDCWGVDQEITVTVPPAAIPGDLAHYDFENPICVQDLSVVTYGAGLFYPTYADDAACDTSTNLVQSIMCNEPSSLPTGCSAICDNSGDSPRVYISNANPGELSNGDIVYSTNDVLDPFNGADYYYMVIFEDISYGVRIDALGVISEITNC
jgi:hypothetical protein